MSDDFRDLVYEWDHSSVCDLVFYRWTPPEFRYGEPIAGTGGFAILESGGPFAYVPSPPHDFIEPLSEGDRARGPVLLWQVAELYNGTEVDTLRTIDPVTHLRADRIHDVDTGKWYDVRTEYNYRRTAKVCGVIAVLIDGIPSDIIEPEDEDP